MAGPSSIRYRSYLVRLTGGEGGSLFAQSCYKDQWGNRYEITLPAELFDPRELERRLSRDPEAVGRALFDGLFGGDGGRFRAALARADGRPRRGVRLRLSFDLSHPAVARAARLPWELLYDPYGGAFLSQSIHTPVVRFLDREDSADRPEAEAPLSVLVIHAEPAGCEPLEVEAEVRALSEAIEGPDVAVRARRASTWDELREHLLETDERCDVVHFIGHGDVGAGEDGAGILWFEGDDGRPQTVNGRELGDILRHKPSIRLVVVNACSTAAQPDDGADPYAGVAHALVRVGVPAVVAMSRSLVDAAARRFSKTFYRALGRREPVDAAVARGRLALRDAKFGPDVWAIPALFLQAEDGEVFRFEARSRWRAGWREGRRWVREHPKKVAAALVMLLLWAGWGAVPPHRLWALVPNPPQCPSPEGLGISWVYVDPARLGLGSSIPPFCLARFETTNELYRKLMPDDAERVRDLDPALPFMGISYEGAVQFADLAALQTGLPIRLPNSDEWKAAAAGGAGAIEGNCGKTGGPLPVGSFAPDRLGLYDMLGNVIEWVHGTELTEVAEGDARPRASYHGGSWDRVLSSCKVESGDPVLTDFRRHDAGFRLAMYPVRVDD